MKKLIFLPFLIGLLACTPEKQKLYGPYLGQPVPGDSPCLFASGIVNDGIPTRDITFTPDGKEIYFGKNMGNSSYATIFFCKETEKGWTDPEVLPFTSDPKYIYIEPFVSPDGKKLFFVLNKGNNFKEANRFITDIWVAGRENGFWGAPHKLDAVINTTDSEFYPSVSNNGNLYFTRENSTTREGYIYKSEFRNGKYLEPVKMPIQINAGTARFNATVSADESYIIIPVFGMPDSFGSTDYYISFFNREKGWSNPLNLGKNINTEGGNEYSAGFSPDGNFFFFMSARINSSKKPEFSWKNFRKLYNEPENGHSNIYWMKADFINDLKEKATFTQKN